jgi:transposase
MPFSIGCDVSKAKLDIAVINEKQELQISFQVVNHPQGFCMLCEKLTPYRDSPVILEATSHYHLGVAFALKELGYVVHVINPLITKKFASSGIRKTKTDKVDAKLLATIGWLEPSLKPWMESRETIEYKRLSQLIGKLSKDRRSYVQRLRQLEELQPLCCIEIQLELVSLHTIIDTLCIQIHTLEKQLAKYLKEETRILSSIPGVGKESAARIAAELGDVSRFTDRDHMTAFSGLDPSKKESGTSIRGRSRISKRGSPELRCVLGQVAWGVMMHNAVFKAYAEKKRKEGKHYYSILVAVAKKLLLIMYSLLKNKQTYDLKYHALHSEMGLTSV